MNKINILAFICGAAVGAIGSYAFCNRYFEKLTEEKVASVKEVYAKKNGEEVPKDTSFANTNDAQSFNTEKVNIMDYANTIREENYMNYSSFQNESDAEAEEAMKQFKEAIAQKAKKEPDIYPIGPNDFGEKDEFDAVTLYFYNDRVLAGADNIKCDIESTVGNNFEMYFDDYERDTAFIRNDRLKVDYEILKDSRNYSDIVPNTSGDD